GFFRMSSPGNHSGDDIRKRKTENEVCPRGLPTPLLISSCHAPAKALPSSLPLHGRSLPAPDRVQSRNHFCFEPQPPKLNDRTPQKTYMAFDNEFTSGIEEEYQIIDPQTRELRSRVNEILDEGRLLLGEQVKPEMHQSMIEVGTGICRDVKEAKADVIKLRRVISELAQKKGLAIVAASTHPISPCA